MNRPRLEAVKAFLRSYDGPKLRLMEVCGTHTGEIARNGIPSMLSDRIELISGPGCPVCVTVTAAIDRLCELCREPDTTVLSFGDLYRVPGTRESLAQAKARGGNAELLYAPIDAVRLAAKRPEHSFVFAAVGFETTAPVYADVLYEAERLGITNLRLLTSLKTMPQVIRRVTGAAAGHRGIDGFLAPGHVAVVTGSAEYEALAEELGIPFVIAPFDAEGLLLSIYALARMRGRGVCLNLYPEAVTERGSVRAREAVGHFFQTADAAWRGLGTIEGSGLELRPEFSRYDAGSGQLTEDVLPEGCRCGEVLSGLKRPAECPLFGRGCTPERPYGACMVSEEGSCRSAYEYG